MPLPSSCTLRVRALASAGAAFWAPDQQGSEGQQRLALRALDCTRPGRAQQALSSPGLGGAQEKGYVTADVASEQHLHQLKLSGTKFRQLLRSGQDIPDWCGLVGCCCNCREPCLDTREVWLCRSQQLPLQVRLQVRGGCPQTRRPGQQQWSAMTLSVYGCHALSLTTWV